MADSDAQPQLPGTRHLRSVEAPIPGFDPETGEVCPGCVERDAELAALETEKRGWRTRYQNAVRDAAAEARAHRLWPIASRLFDLYKRESGRERVRWTPDRFELVRPFIEAEGEDDCILAVRGLLGSEWHRENGYRDWEHVFSPRKDAQARFERHRDYGSQLARAAEGRPEAEDWFDRWAPLGAAATKRERVEALRARVFLLEVETDPRQARKLLGEIHGLSDAGG